jgi:hypothetical protein
MEKFRFFDHLIAEVYSIPGMIFCDTSLAINKGMIIDYCRNLLTTT